MRDPNHLDAEDFRQINKVLAEIVFGPAPKHNPTIKKQVRLGDCPIWDIVRHAYEPCRIVRINETGTYELRCTGASVKSAWAFTVHPDTLVDVLDTPWFAINK